MRFLLVSSPAGGGPVAKTPPGAWRVFSDGPSPLVLRDGPGFRLLADAVPPAQLMHADDEGFCLLTGAMPVNWMRQVRWDARDILAHVRSEGSRVLHELMPPFGAVLQSQREGSVSVVTDHVGLQHVYCHVSARGVLVSSSPLLLAALAGADPDASALLSFFRLGHFLGDDSGYRGVKKLRGGRSWTIERGGLGELPTAIEEVEVSDGPDCVRHCVAAHIVADPGIGIELSGGLDSRLILASMSPDQRRGRRAMTLGLPGSSDLAIAERIARDVGLDWLSVDLAKLDAEAPENLLARLRQSSERCSHMMQPLARLVLDWANERVAPWPRFSGQNGEFLRGFYYPGFVEHETFGPEHVRKLLHWRLLTNESIPSSLVPAEVWRSHDQELANRLSYTLHSYGMPWLRATDEMYLYERMQHWAGGGYSAEARGRAIHAPFFDPRFIAYARRVSPAAKRNSVEVAALICRLDPVLGRYPTAGGPSPWTQGRAGLVGGMARQVRFAKKAVRKVAQRLGFFSHGPVGAEAVALRLVESKLITRDTFPRVSRLDWLQADAIDAIISRGAGNWASIGYLLALEWALEDLDRGRDGN